MNSTIVITAGTQQAQVLDLLTYAQASDLNINFIVEQDAYLNLKIVGLGELELNLDLKIDLVGINAQAKMTGALFLTKQSKLNLRILQNHLVPDCQSNVQIKTVLLDNANFDYCGTIFIGEQASNTIAHQENKNIVLSPAVTVKSVPNIEVLNTDVTCGHGSAIGELDREQFLYLMSRGLSPNIAKKLLLESFLQISLVEFF